MIRVSIKTNMTTKEKTELYYAKEKLDSDLRIAFWATRKEPGLSIKDIGNVIKNVFTPEEKDQLINELKI